MAHADQVQALMRRLGIPDPLIKQDLKIKALLFSKPAGNNELTDLPLFEGIEDKAVLLYLQHLAAEQGLGDMIFFSEQIRRDMAEYFAERWNYEWLNDDGSLLNALYRSARVRIFWEE